jgi:hypothetical protein
MAALYPGVCCQHQSNSICRENIKVCQRAGLALCGWGKLGARNGVLGWVGKVSDLVFWNRPISPAEISLHYHVGRGGMFQRRRLRRGYVSKAAVVKSYLFVNRGQVIGGGAL